MKCRGPSTSTRCASGKVVPIVVQTSSGLAKITPELSSTAIGPSSGISAERCEAFGADHSSELGADHLAVEALERRVMIAADEDLGAAPNQHASAVRVVSTFDRQLAHDLVPTLFEAEQMAARRERYEKKIAPVGEPVDQPVRRRRTARRRSQ